MDYKIKEDTLCEQPNIILIFTEGISKHIILDERNIMPNIRALQEESLSFDNYYNHTFATYRGLIGQLYSGYQFNDLDTNPFMSVQSILKDEGYHTIYINSEPRNVEFTQYLSSFAFDEFMSDENYKYNGLGNTIADEDMYELLFETATAQLDNEKPFFLCTYTVGTHASFDSSDQKYGDGTNAMLNKYYNVDYHFGEFMKKFKESPLADNTILVFTTDHATYQDDSFNNAFPAYNRFTTALDEVPLFIYYKGITPNIMDVNGRNTLCLAPTILDYLDISAPNCFLGTSLFSDTANSICETSNNYNATYHTTKDGIMAEFSKKELEEFRTILERYFIMKQVVLQME